MGCEQLINDRYAIWCEAEPEKHVGLLHTTIAAMSHLIMARES